jgi:hypothetical protein
MKKAMLMGVLASVFLVMGLSPVYATPYLIEDHYIGAAPTNHSYEGKDVIGESKWFGIEKMIVDLAEGWLNVDIYSGYFDNIGKYYTTLGDLFISTDGWRPNGSAEDRYKNDSAANGGEHWEYALVMDSRPANSDGSLSGSLGLYQVNENNIIYSGAPSGYIYRAQQEVGYDPNGAAALAAGSWGITKGANEQNILSYSISTEAMNIIGDEIGFHWTMSCGNDVIEGAVPTPEPATILLFGLGLIGLTTFIRKKRIQ